MELKRRDLSLTRMDSFHVVLYILWLTLSCLGTYHNSCRSPKYLQLGRRGIVECFFYDEFYGVVWYNRSGYERRESLLRLIDGEMEGDGYSSGEYDIFSNGSLVIKNVTLQHDQSFIVLKFESESDVDPIVQTVRVIVTVKPEKAFPIISQCRITNETCFMRLNPGANLSCFIKDTKPAINLTWVIRTAEGDLNISSLSSVVEKGPLFTSNVTISAAFSQSSILSLLVCKATDALGMLLKNEIAVFLENSALDLSNSQPQAKYVEKDFKMEISCSEGTHSLIVWQKRRQREGVFDIVALAALFDEGFSQEYSEEYQLREDGALAVSQVDIKHEGLYKCVFQDRDNAGDMAVFDVIVYVPAYPIIHGCPTNQPCVFETQKEGSITCSVIGIRPVVNLELGTFHEKDSSLITFSNKDITINNNKDTYDVYVSSKYRLNTSKLKSNQHLTIVCKITEPKGEALRAQATLNLSLIVEERSFQPQPSGSHWWINGVIIAVAISVICICIAIGVYVAQKGRRKERQNESVEKCEEGHFLLAPTSEADLREKRSVLIKELKGKYVVLCNSIHPVPYHKGQEYCVDSIFVECGIQYLAADEGKESHGKGENLHSYHEILNDCLLKSSRCILEGDPGYGKSTIALKLAYDWCNQKHSSSLSAVSIFILLRLRQLGGVSSIFSAIKQFILPNDSQLSETDIKNIITNTQATLIILEGYDEYPDQDNTQTDVNKIISKDILQDVAVILTTRSSYLPQRYAAGTKKFRLTGFNDVARETYIRKALVKNNDAAAANIKQKFEDNPVLVDLCQVPLFFVMFAHMTHDSKESLLFTSVTSFVRHMISCFHSHMKNKTEDKNVSKVEILDNAHHKLDKVAFECLTGNVKQIIWEKEDIQKRIGMKIYDLYTRIGILVAKENFLINDSPGTAMSNHIQHKTKVRFFHQVFCEWYAAHFVSGKVENMSGKELAKFVQKLNPSNTQYVFRFACGLNPSSGGKIINYLKNVDGADKFTVLCILEQEGKVDEILDTVKSLCSKTVQFEGNREHLFQRSTIQLLEIAAGNAIPISVLFLLNCFNGVILTKGHLQLKSDLSIPVLTTLNVLVIHEKGKEITGEEIEGLFNYSSRCTWLKVLSFEYCILPQLISTESLSVLRSRNVEVSWSYGWGRYRLLLATGAWERVVDGVVMSADDHEKALRAIRSRETSPMQDMC